MKQKSPSFFALIRSVIGWFLVAAVTLAFFGPLLITALIVFPFDRTRRYTHRIVSSWARAILVVLPLMRVRIEGERHLAPDSVYVLVANHQSVADILAVLHLPHPFKFIAKRELFWIPILGWSLTAAGYIPLERGNPKSGKQTIDQAKKYLKEGMSVLFFPEGTRSHDGEIHDFKAGAFKIASELGIPVVPIVIDGTREVVPKGNFILRKQERVVVKAGAPRRPRSASNDNVGIFAGETREEMINMLDAFRQKQLNKAFT